MSSSRGSLLGVYDETWQCYSGTPLVSDILGIRDPALGALDKKISKSVPDSFQSINQAYEYTGPDIR